MNFSDKALREARDGGTFREIANAATLRYLELAPDSELAKGLRARFEETAARRDAEDREPVTP